jgi:1,4-dihydroxy-2-naphthoate octaprenyltransferase
MATRAQWISGARLRTLPLAVAPVLVGTGAAIQLEGGFGFHGRTDGLNFCGSAAVAPTLLGAGRSIGDSIGHCGFWGWDDALRALLALIVSLALQVAVNYANDYSDGIRGTDDNRVGPFRLTGSRAATPEQVKNAAFIAFGVAAAAGLGLVIGAGQLWLLLVGAACVLAAWYYTGGKRPYGYAGFGEIVVFIFFGLVAVLGTTYTQVGTISWPALAGAVGVGAFACAVLVVNNLRDVPTDALAGKITLAVRLGDARTRVFYLALVVLPFVTALATAITHPWALLALLAVPLAVPPVRTVRGDARGLALLPVLRDTGRLALVYALLLTVGLSV